MPPLKIGSSPRRKRHSPTMGSCKNYNNTRDEKFSPSIFGNELPFPSHHDHFSSNSSSSHLKPTTSSSSITSPKTKQKPIDHSFEDHLRLGKRISKSMYFHKLPSTPRPSLPLTVLAVKSFTSEVFGNSDTLEFLDLEMASEIGRNACVSPTALIMALVYLERLSTSNPSYLSSIKPSELFVVSLLVASKFLQDDGEDCGVYNDEWATSSKMDLKHINRLELQFLDAINWSINVTRDEFDKALVGVEHKLALNQGLRRGWFTYTEIGSLSQLILSWGIIGPIIRDYILQVVTVASMTYTALIATVLSSSLLGPQIYALTKTMLLSSSIFYSTTTGTTQGSGSLCPGFSNNVTGFHHHHNHAISKLPYYNTYHRDQQQQGEGQISNESTLDAEVMTLENILSDDTNGKETNDTEITQQLLIQLLNIERLGSIISKEQKFKTDHNMQQRNLFTTTFGKMEPTRVENHQTHEDIRTKLQEHVFKTVKFSAPFCDQNGNRCNKFETRDPTNLWNSGNPLEFSNYIKV